MISLAAGISICADPATEIEVGVTSLEHERDSYKQVSLRVGGTTLTLLVTAAQLRQIVNVILQDELK